MDFGIDPLFEVIVGIDAGLRSINQRLRDEDWFDGLFALEHAEPLLGLGFVAAQVFVHNTWADLNAIRSDRGKAPFGKIECYQHDEFLVDGKHTRIEVINAISNYFKHHEEWAEWPENLTTRTLASLGITESTEFPCIKVTERFCGQSWEFVVVHQVVKEWRKQVLQALA